MALFPSRRYPVIRPRPDGRFDLVLHEAHREVVGALLGELDELIEADPGASALRRLSPPAYLDDVERDAAYQLLAGEELRTARRAAIEVVRSTLARSVLREDEVWAWLRALNALRLVVGTKLDITDDEYDPAIEADHPDAPLWAIYDFTGDLQLAILTALD